MEMVMHRDYVLRTTKGHSFQFRKGVTIDIPKICVPDAVAVGAVPSDGGDPNVINEAAAVNTGPSEPAERQKALFGAFETLAMANIRDDFTAAGLPHLHAVARELTWAVSAKERNVMWAQYKAQAGAE